MTLSLSNNCTKNYYNRTLTVQVIVEDVITWIFLRQCIYRKCEYKSPKSPLAGGGAYYVGPTTGHTAGYVFVYPYLIYGIDICSIQFIKLSICKWVSEWICLLPITGLPHMHIQNQHDPGSRDVREWLSTFPYIFPPIPILSMLKLYIICSAFLSFTRLVVALVLARLD